MVNRLNLYLSSQSIYIVGFEFPTMGSPMVGDPVAHSCFANPSLFSHKAAPFSLDIVALFSLFSLQNCQPPNLSHYPPIYSLR